MEISKVFGQYIRSAFWGNKKPPAVAEGCGCILTQANISSETLSLIFFYVIVPQFWHE